MMRQTPRFVISATLALGLGAGIAVMVMSHGRFESIATASAPVAVAIEPARIASVDVLGIVARFLESDRYKPSNIEKAQKFDTQLKALIGELSLIEKQGQGLTQQSPEFAPLQQQFQAKQREFEQARNDAQGQIEQFNTNQVTEAYRLTVEAANSLASELGYSHIIVSRGEGAKINSNNVAGAVQEIIARPLIKSNAADDLTERLIKQFGLENVVLDAPPAATAPAADPAGAPAPTPVEAVPATPK